MSKNSHGWDIKKMEDLTFSIDLQFKVLADIGLSADGEPELQDIKLPGLWIDDEFVVLEGFKNVLGESIIDILKDRFSDNIHEMAVAELNKHKELMELLS